MIKRLFSLLVAAWACLGALAASDNYTVIVSLDGFRWDYAEAFNTKFFDYMAKNGVKAVMQPSFPSKTFPNHYTLATGLYPDHHGIIANSFRDRMNGKTYSLGNGETRNDPKYYLGDPIWLTAKRQGVKTACVYWVGSDVAIKGEHPTYWKDYQVDRLTFTQRVDEVERLLTMPEADRPHLVMCYFEEPDHNGHNYGPISALTRKAIEDMDSIVSSMWARLQSHKELKGKVNLIVTGDHGMTYLSPERTVSIKKYIKDNWVAEIDNDVPALIYAKAPECVDSIYNALQGVAHINVWRRADIPAYLHYGTNPNMGDVIVLPEVGWMFTDKKIKYNTGTHGFDNTCSDMQVGFRAMGPDFKEGYVRAHSFRNVCVHPLLAHLLGVRPAQCDGSVREVADMLKEDTTK